MTHDEQVDNLVLHGPDGETQLWFDAPSLAAGAALVQRLGTVLPDGRLRFDLRHSGVRVRLEPGRDTDTSPVAGAAAALGLAANPATLQAVGVLVETSDVTATTTFWSSVLGCPAADLLTDPLRRNPPFFVRRVDSVGDLRYRMHVDVVRVPDAVDATRTAVDQQPHGPFGLALSDPDGTEVDLVPGDALPGGDATSDWRVLFGAMTFYPTKSLEASSRFVSAVAGLADDARVPLRIDAGPDGVVLDSGKDQWADEEFGREPRFIALAAEIQAVAAAQSLVAEPDRLSFVQIGLDAVDVPAVQAFWAAALDYRPDPRDGVTDLVDPRGLNPVLFLQEMDSDDDARRQQRDRLHLTLALPADAATARVDRAVAAGGRVLEQASDQWVIADPEGNELRLSRDPGAGADR